MAETHARKILDDRINILDKNAADASPTWQIFITVSAILALIRVRVLVPVPPADPHQRANQDEMIDSEDSVQLSKYCFNACLVMETAIRGENVGDLSRPVRVVLEDLERYVN